MKAALDTSVLVSALHRAHPLEASDYRGAIDRCADRGFSSGVVFDALHLVAAERAGAELLLTFNLGDFVRLQTQATPRIVSPSELAPTA